MITPPCKEVARAGQSCRRWQVLSTDNILWRKIIFRDFRIENRSRLDNLETSSWRAEYQRLVDNTPEICTEVSRVFLHTFEDLSSQLVQVLDTHTNEVLHVSFCQSGDRFVTCSKDGSFIVWSVRYVFSMMILVIRTYLDSSGTT